MVNNDRPTFREALRFWLKLGCISFGGPAGQIAPRPFHPELIELCDAAIKETVPQSHRLPLGPLHDAAEVCGAGVPTIMMFVQSLHGISHNKIEDTKEEHLELCVAAFDKLAEKAMKWILKAR